MSILLAAGLGNPGSEYAGTRHNLGWVVIDAFAARHGLPWEKSARFEAMLARWDRPGLPTCWLAKPLSFMNDSGRPLAAISRYHQIAPEQVAVVYDEYTIEVGRAKVSITGSAGGHNGVASVLQHLGGGFARYRIGIGSEHPSGMDLKDFVLGKFDSHQQTIIQKSLDHYLDGLELLLTGGVEQAMNTINRRETHDTKPS